jgi:hypothetical protein
MGQIQLLRRVRALLSFFTIALIVSGITAIPLVWEMKALRYIFLNPDWGIVFNFPGFLKWLDVITTGVIESYTSFPFLAYGTDWLAFGHIVIGIAFIGAIKDPVRNIWVIHLGMIACGLVIPWAVLSGLVRSIPLFWTLIDWSFGIIGFIPLWLAQKYTLELEYPFTLPTKDTRNLVG